VYRTRFSGHKFFLSHPEHRPTLSRATCAAKRRAIAVAQPSPVNPANFTAPVILSLTMAEIFAE